ncbi:MAG: alpha/beta hydrolase [Candidatus Wallbacteria bacterium]|nr:alpha/beta hydrolase [Candidatus Wallbacteria bacterium]
MQTHRRSHGATRSSAASAAALLAVLFLLPAARAQEPARLGRRGVVRELQLHEGLNLVAMPLAARSARGTPLAASDLAHAASTPFVVRFATDTPGLLRALPFLPDFPATDFPLRSTEAYLLAAPGARRVRVRGNAWPPAALARQLPRGLSPLSLPHGVPEGASARGLLSTLGLRFAIAAVADAETGRGRLRTILPDAGPDVPLTDGRGLLVSAATSSAVTLPAANSPPVASPETAQTLSQSAGLALVSGASEDPDGDPLIYSWFRPTESAPFSITTSPVLRLPPVAPGEHRFELSVSDGALASARASIVVTVIPDATAGQSMMRQSADPSRAARLAAAGVSIALPQGALTTGTALTITQSADLMDETSTPGWRLTLPVAISIDRLAVAGALDGQSPLIDLVFDVPAGSDWRTLFGVVAEEVMIGGSRLPVRRLLTTAPFAGPPEAPTHVVATIPAAALTDRTVELRTYEHAAEWTFAPTLFPYGAEQGQTRAVIFLHGLQQQGALGTSVGLTGFADTEEAVRNARRDVWSTPLGRARFDGGPAPLREAFSASIDALRAHYDFFEYWYPSARPIDENGRELARLAALKPQVESFILVGKSMGGLVARRAAEELGSRVEAIVTLATPHHGSFFPLMLEGAQEADGFERLRDQLDGQFLPRDAKTAILSRVGGTLLTPGVRDLGWDGLVPAGRDRLQLLPGRPNLALAELNRRTRELARTRLIATFGGTSGPRMPAPAEEGGRILSVTAFPAHADSDVFVPRASALPEELVGSEPPGLFFGRLPDGSFDRSARFNLVGHSDIVDEPQVVASLLNFLSAQATALDGQPPNHPPIARPGPSIDYNPSGFPEQIELVSLDSTEPDTSDALPMYFWSVFRGDLPTPSGFAGGPDLARTATGPIVPFQALGPGTWEIYLATVDGRGGIGLCPKLITYRPIGGNRGVTLAAGPADATGATSLTWSPSTAASGGISVFHDVRPGIKDDLNLGVNSLASGFDFAFNLTATSLAASGLADGATWYFRLFDGPTSARGSSNEIAVRVPPAGIPPPEPVGSFAAAPAGPGSVRVSWTPAAGTLDRVATYRLVSSTSASVSLYSGRLRWASALASESEVTLTGLDGGQRLHFRLFTVDLDENVAGSAVAAADVP